MIDALPTDGRERINKVKDLRLAVEQVAIGLAELHKTFGHNESGKPAMMTRAAKLNDANYFLDKSLRDGGRDVSQVRTALGDDFTRVKAAIEGPMLEAFLGADVPATAYHGDANAGNFKLAGDHFEKLGVFDVGSMDYSIDPATKLGIKTGAADVARFKNSLETLAPGKLNASELAELRAAFDETYFQKYRVGPGNRPVNRTAYEQAERWYKIEMEVAILKNDSRAKARLLSILGLSGGG